MCNTLGQKKMGDIWFTVMEYMRYIPSIFKNNSCSFPPQMQFYEQFLKITFLFFHSQCN